MASVAVLAGGISAEREISIKTGDKIAASLERSGYDVKIIDPIENFWLDLNEFNPDTVFIALHGRFGEDGTVQGMLEMMGLEYVGSGVLSSAVAMDKIASKHIFSSVGISSPKYHTLCQDSYSKDIETLVKVVKPPFVIKPSCEGSAIGIKLVDSLDQVETCVKEALTFGDKLLIEEFIDGPEVTIGILGNNPQVVLETVQIVHSNAFYDYDAKYTPGKSNHIIPAQLPVDIAEECKRLALQAHNVLNCRDFSRVDIKISKDMSEVVVLEVNTIPGMTETSLYPEAASASGYSFDELIDLLVKLSLDRGSKKHNSSTITV